MMVVIVVVVMVVIVVVVIVAAVDLMIRSIIPKQEIELNNQIMNG